ncbi:MAG TPA: hypothetical protein PKJ56_11135 [Promineifilum sp.]|nr:hypothetical protein [Promineifilum sp.]
MKSRFESSCITVLASCLVAGLGLSLLAGQCSMLGIVIVLARITGIADGVVEVAKSLPERMAAKYGLPAVAGIT